MVPKGSDDQIHARQALRQVFPGCDEASIDEALQQLHWQQLSAGDVLLQLDAPGDSAYLLLQGSLALPNLAISGARSLVDDLNRTGYCKWLSSLAATIH